MYESSPARKILRAINSASWADKGENIRYTKIKFIIFSKIFALQKTETDRRKDNAENIRCSRSLEEPINNSAYGIIVHDGILYLLCHKI